jgi:putative FmdB family regulatory protein
MPLYEYRCAKCDCVFEEFAGFSANGSRKCPECGGVAKRLISAPQVVFHGSGFYRTDSANASSASTNGSSSSTGSESKPAPKPAKPKTSE